MKIRWLERAVNRGITPVAVQAVCAGRWDTRGEFIPTPVDCKWKGQRHDITGKAYVGAAERLATSDAEQHQQDTIMGNAFDDGDGTSQVSHAVRLSGIYPS